MHLKNIALHTQKERGGHTTIEESKGRLTKLRGKVKRLQLMHLRRQKRQGTFSQSAGRARAQRQLLR